MTAVARVGVGILFLVMSALAFTVALAVYPDHDLFVTGSATAVGVYLAAVAAYFAAVVSDG